ncbi:related to ribosomal protein L16 precursor, mitochondrial [Rhynchosporium secalis]|uniref:Related to ribosomal protein L16, mitochondrial n=1 Tax=Rhynchosporium secalis TaxID=38038 RepID=A0A1E1LXL1_RHYSE|nr:related to ribosomal protein L16 precursor, mitochondrial [Rhynchosporium secalis]
MKLQIMSSLTACVNKLSIASTPLRPVSPALVSVSSNNTASAQNTSISRRPFSSTSARAGTWLLPTASEKKRSRKGRPRVPTGGSARGTTMVWGDYGLRMADHHRRVSATQLKIGEEAIKVRLKGMKYRLYKRVCASIGVYSSGNEVRMGKGKGSFDHWASRIAVSKVIFELKGDIHEQVARDAFRIAGNKMPGMYEFVKKGDAPVVGITKLDGVTLAELKKPRRKDPLPMPGVLAAAAAAATSTSATISTSMSPEA